MKLKIFSVIIIAALLIPAAANAQFAVPHSVLANGGGLMSGANFKTTGTIGQPIIGLSAGASNQTGAGFWYISQGLLTGIEQIPDLLPKEFRLEQNYPNPFNPVTTIEFSVPRRASVSLKIYDLLGNEVAVLVNSELEGGAYKVKFDAASLSSGVYFSRFESEGFVQTRKLTLLK